MDIIERLERRDETAIELLKAHYGDYCYGIYAAIAVSMAILMAHVVSLISKKTGSIIATIILSATLLLIPAMFFLFL